MSDSTFDNESQKFQQKIAEWLKKVHFKKKMLGGVSETDVWKKIGELNSMYEAALSEERTRYNTLIEHYRKSCIIAVKKNRNSDLENSQQQEFESIVLDHPEGDTVEDEK